MPQGIKGWAIWLAAQALLTLALKLVVKLVDNALISWGDDTIAAWLGITSPSSSTVFNWGLPFALAAVALWFYHYFTARPLQKALAERSGGDRFSATGTVGNGLPDRTWIRRVEPTTLIIGGLIGIAVFAICAAVGLIIWQQSRPTAPVVATNIQLGAPPDLEGSPLAWESAPYLGWQKQSDGRIDARTIAIRGKNIGKEEVQLTDAYIVSGITGKRLSMTIFGRNPDGTGSMTLPKDTYPIHPTLRCNYQPTN